MKRLSKILAVILAVVMLISCIAMFSACGGKEQIVIYSAAAQHRIAHMQQTLNEKFPNYDIIVEYQGTSTITSKILAEGLNTGCDIIHDLAYTSLDALNEKGLLATLSDYDTSVFVSDLIKGNNYLPECRTGGAIIVNTEVLAEKNLEKPTCYEDLLKPEYKGLISMPNPQSSGTGYMFLKSLVNAWGEEEAMNYFSQLKENVLEFTSSGTAPVTALVQKEVAICLSMTATAVLQINEGAPIEILFFEEGSPYSTYGQSIVKGKDERECVKEVFDFLINEYTEISAKANAPEKIFAEKDFVVDNFPTNINYSDMSNDTLAEKTRLLEIWEEQVRAD